MSDLDDGLADVGVGRGVCAPLHKRAVYLDLGEWHLAYSFEAERAAPEIIDRYRGPTLPKLRQACLQRLHLVDDLALRDLKDQTRPVAALRPMQRF